MARWFPFERVGMPMGNRLSICPVQQCTGRARELWPAVIFLCPDEGYGSGSMGCRFGGLRAKDVWV